MKKPYIPFLVFLIFLLLIIPLSFDFATSVVPGWHITIFQPHFIGELIVMIVLLLVTIGYWLLAKQKNKINQALFAIHFSSTIATTIFLKFPTLLLYAQLTNKDELMRDIELRIKLIPFAWSLFIVGQILFLIYCIKTIKVKCAFTYGDKQ
ncbi:MAG TPA: hypothetical protein VFN30_04530 [Chitinophagaceae bacterium]|nr:hypothetical protein [Chitinophagaceae bacterium]